MTSPPSLIDPHSALIYIMVTMSAADSTMTDHELKKIGNIVSNLPVFRDFDSARIVRTAEACGAILGEEDGLDTVLGMVRAALPARLHETAYALAVEVAAADLDVHQEELRLLQILRTALNVDRLSAIAIERGARARHMTLPG